MGWADTGIFGGFLTLADRRIWDWQTLTKVWFLLTVRSGSCLDRWQPKREIKTLLFLNLKIYKKVAWIRWHHLHLQWKFKLLAGKFTWVNKQNIARCCHQTSCFQKFVDNAQQCFAFTIQANFPANNLKVIGLNPGYPLKSFLF